ncbi:carboxypeptidase-like regulatory domain-containing protein [Anseongella ginsenosidimutans]|uniref:carboxypeptidase-like regulatory domain-containing protein n=1 Tax=Anseongella ginsenosidimutans TaxID=496056 RepID=UPI0013152D3C|nr:carboxypeptidase-like regulatory domain-containing protein [Anseongella ginsenosidimutans]
MNIKLLLLAAFITFNFFARAQNTSGLQGSVSNELSAPLEGASITILNTNFSTFTSEDGDFQFVDIPYGDYVIQVSAAGYASIHREVQLPADSRLDLQLSRAADQLDAVTVTAQKREENLQRVPSVSVRFLPER